MIGPDFFLVSFLLLNYDDYYYYIVSCSCRLPRSIGITGFFLSAFVWSQRFFWVTARRPDLQRHRLISTQYLTWMFKKKRERKAAYWEKKKNSTIKCQTHRNCANTILHLDATVPYEICIDSQRTGFQTRNWKKGTCVWSSTRSHPLKAPRQQNHNFSLPCRLAISFS